MIYDKYLREIPMGHLGMSDTDIDAAVQNLKVHYPPVSNVWPDDLLPPERWFDFLEDAYLFARIHAYTRHYALVRSGGKPGSFTYFICDETSGGETHKEQQYRLWRHQRAEKAAKESVEKTARESVEVEDDFGDGCFLVDGRATRRAFTGRKECSFRFKCTLDESSGLWKLSHCWGKNGGGCRHAHLPSCHPGAHSSVQNVSQVFDTFREEMEEKLNGKPGHERLDPIQFMTASEEREYMRATNPLAVNATNYTYYQRRKKRRLEQRENLPPHEAVLSLLGRAKYMRVRTNYFQPPPKEQETLADEPQESEEQSKFDFEKDDVVIEREGVAVQADADVFDPITTEKADDSYANPLGGDMNALFFANTDGYRFWRAYSEVVMVDATYITGFNRNKYCLVNISGVCALNKSFPFACCFVAEETQVSFKWVFTQLRDMFDNYRIPYPKVVVIDGGKQVISASESVFLNVPVGISS